MREWVSSWESWGEDDGLPVAEEQRSENTDEQDWTEQGFRSDAIEQPFRFTQRTS